MKTLDAGLKKGLQDLCSEDRESRDSWGNMFYWESLKSPAVLPAAATLLANNGARLCMITALARSTQEHPGVYIDYHFAVDGNTVSLIVHLDDEGENAEVPTITPWFRNADWHEREFSELFGIKVRGNTNPNRLFLDPEIDAGALRNIVPLTVMMNGACTKDLWEKVMEANQESKGDNA